MSAQAPSATLAHVPAWCEGESLYGWSARLHALRGGKARITGRLLFGREHACRAVEFPPGIGRLAQATGGALGSTEAILRERTVLAAYWPFCSSATRKMVLDAAMDVSGIPIPMALGLPASRLGADHPLRYCERCHQDALASEGYSTWLLRHQLPGAWWCTQHERPLAQVVGRRAVWRRPGRDADPLGEPQCPEERKALHTMALLAEAIARMEHVEEASLAAAAVHRLRQLGIATSAARLNAAKMAQWLQQAPLIRWMRRQGDRVRVPSGNWAVSLLRGRSRAHPLKWQILWTCAWQLDTAEAAVQAFSEAARNQRPFTPVDQTALWGEEEREPLRLPLPRRVEEAFDTHATMREVAQALGTNLGSVRQWLADYPALAQGWLTRVRADRLHRAVLGIESRMREQPHLGRTQLLKACSSEFNWLSRHAPATARALLDRVPTDRGSQRELFRWLEAGAQDEAAAA